MGFWFGVLIGGIFALILAPIGFIIYSKIQMNKIKKQIKTDLANGNFLKPIDKRDFDFEKWSDLIQIDENEVKELGDKIFKRGKYAVKKVNEEDLWEIRPNALKDEKTYLNSPENAQENTFNAENKGENKENE